MTLSVNYLASSSGLKQRPPIRDSTHGTSANNLLRLVMTKKTDSAATVDESCKLSNSALHEQMTEGVDECDFRMRTRAKLLEAGVPVEALDRVLPEKPDGKDQ
jgi:hypothetical protein